MAEQRDPRTIYQVNSKGGIQKDGTVLDSASYVDGQWVRFYRGRPRKMGGYKAFVEDLSYLPRASYVYSKNNNNLVYLFSSDKVNIVQIDNNGVGGLLYDVTPSGFTANADYLWQVDRIFDSTGGGTNYLLAHAATNASDITNETDTPLYYSTAGSTSSLFAPVDNGSGGQVSVSGGVVVLQPYVFAYGSNGLIKNSNVNKPNDWRITVGGDANAVNVSGTKIVKGLPLRGGAQAPAGLFWSLDSVVRVSYVGGASIFRYDTVSAKSTVMSSNGIVEYDGQFFWLGIDRFYVYNGQVQELPNQMNINWFFDNLNFAQKQKVWAMVNQRWGEIWWFFPYGTATECTHAVIFNVREGTWYHTEVARGCGSSAQVLRFPVLCGNVATSGGKYIAYGHELGYNKIEAGQEVAIRSYIETADFGYPTGGADGEKPVGQDYWTRLTRVEPDLVQTGEMTLSVIGSEFANDQTPKTTSYEFSPDTAKIDMREQRRMIRLGFESNTAGGFFEMGRIIVHTEPGDIRS